MIAKTTIQVLTASPLSPTACHTLVRLHRRVSRCRVFLVSTIRTVSLAPTRVEAPTVQHFQIAVTMDRSARSAKEIRVFNNPVNAVSALTVKLKIKSNRICHVTNVQTSTSAVTNSGVKRITCATTR
jgi:hypothetical protein